MLVPLSAYHCRRRGVLFSTMLELEWVLNDLVVLDLVIFDRGRENGGV